MYQSKQSQEMRYSASKPVLIATEIESEKENVESPNWLFPYRAVRHPKEVGEEEQEVESIPSDEMVQKVEIKTKDSKELWKSKTEEQMFLKEDIEKAVPAKMLKYTYADGQWSPINPQGKKHYDRKFLLQVQLAPGAVIKPPGLPEIPDIILDKPRGLSWGGLYASRPDDTYDFTTNYIWKNTPGVSNWSKPVLIATEIESEKENVESPNWLFPYRAVRHPKEVGEEEQEVESIPSDEMVQKVEIKTKDSKELRKSKTEEQMFLKEDIEKAVPAKMLKYTYADGQWSPINPQGKKHYDRKFLLQVQLAPGAVIKPPGLPEIPDIILDKPRGLSWGGLYASRPDGTYDFTTNYIWKNTPGVSNWSKPVLIATEIESEKENVESPNWLFPYRAVRHPKEVGEEEQEVESIPSDEMVQKVEIKTKDSKELWKSKTEEQMFLKEDIEKAVPAKMLKYTYADGQWSPINPQGKKHYDRKFLLQVQLAPGAVIKPPGLPEIPDIILDKPRGLSWGGLYASRPDGTYDFTTNYIWKNTPGVSKRSKPVLIATEIESEKENVESPNWLFPYRAVRHPKEVEEEEQEVESIPSDEMVQKVEIKTKDSKELWKSQAEEQMFLKEDNEKAVPAKMLKYTYADGQWSPINPQGKKHYDRKFLLQVQLAPGAVIKPPGLPEIPDIILDKPRGLSWGGLYASRPDGTYDFTTNYIWNVTNYISKRSKPVLTTTGIVSEKEIVLSANRLSPYRAARPLKEVVEEEEEQEVESIPSDEIVQKVETKDSKELWKSQTEEQMVLKEDIEKAVPAKMLKYTYADGQWSPINLQGKKQYDRKFLLQFQLAPGAVIKPPGLPEIPDIILDKPRGLSRGVLYDSRPDGTFDFTTNYIWTNTPEGSKWPRSLPWQSSDSTIKKRGPRQRQINISVSKDVELLHKAEDAWKPSHKDRKETAGEEDAETESEPVPTATEIESEKENEESANWLSPDRGWRAPTKEEVESIPSDEMVQKVQIKNECSEQLWKSQTEEEMDSEEDIENEVPAQMLKYPYAEDQWSPINPKGKRNFDRKFFLQFQLAPGAFIKPTGLPDIPDIILDKPHGLSQGRVSALRTAGTYDFTTNYIWTNTPGGSKWPWSLPWQSGSSTTKERDPHQRQNNILLPKVKELLHEAEATRKPSLKDWKKTSSEENAETEDLSKKTQSMLNKLAPQKFQTLFLQMPPLKINTESKRKGISDLVFEKSEPVPTATESESKKEIVESANRLYSDRAGRPPRKEELESIPSNEMVQKVQIKTNGSEQLLKSQTEEKMDSKADIETEVPAQTLKYSYADDQSPINPKGKKHYDRKFLIQFQLSPAAAIKPTGLPDIPEIILDKPHGLSRGGLYASRPDGTYDFTTNYIWTNTPGGSKWSRPLQWPSSSSTTKEWDPPQRQNNMSISKDIEVFHKAEEPWKPSHKDWKKTSSEKATETEDLNTKTRNILNKWAPQNFQTLFPHMQPLKINTPKPLPTATETSVAAEKENVGLPNQLIPERAVPHPREEKEESTPSDEMVRKVEIQIGNSEELRKSQTEEKMDLKENIGNEVSAQMLTFAENQRSPINAQGKKHYDKESLLQFQLASETVIKPPGLPEIPDNILDKAFHKVQQQGIREQLQNTIQIMQNQPMYPPGGGNQTFPMNSSPQFSSNTVMMPFHQSQQQGIIQQFQNTIQNTQNQQMYPPGGGNQALFMNSSQQPNSNTVMMPFYQGQQQGIRQQFPNTMQITQKQQIYPPGGGNQALFMNSSPQFSSQTVMKPICQGQQQGIRQQFPNTIQNTQNQQPYPPGGGNQALFINSSPQFSSQTVMMPFYQGQQQGVRQQFPNTIKNTQNHPIYPPGGGNQALFMKSFPQFSSQNVMMGQQQGIRQLFPNNVQNTQNQPMYPQGGRNQALFINSSPADSSRAVMMPDPPPTVTEAYVETMKENVDPPNQMAPDRSVPHFKEGKKEEPTPSNEVVQKVEIQIENPEELRKSQTEEEMDSKDDIENTVSAQMPKYKHAEDQWSPNNPQGKKHYDREFLLQFQLAPESVLEPPGLPKITDIILDMDSIYERKLREEVKFDHGHQVKKHLQEQHSGFCYKCPHCGKMLARRMARGACPTRPYEMILFERSTGAKLEEAAKHVRTYQEERHPHDWQEHMKQPLFSTPISPLPKTERLVSPLQTCYRGKNGATEIGYISSVPKKHKEHDQEQDRLKSSKTTAPEPTPFLLSDTLDDLDLGHNPAQICLDQPDEYFICNPDPEWEGITFEPPARDTESLSGLKPSESLNESDTHKSEIQKNTSLNITEENEAKQNKTDSNRAKKEETQNKTESNSETKEKKQNENEMECEKKQNETESSRGKKEQKLNQTKSDTEKKEKKQNEIEIDSEEKCKEQKKFEVDSVKRDKTENNMPAIDTVKSNENMKHKIEISEVEDKHMRQTDKSDETEKDRSYKRKIREENEYENSDSALTSETESNTVNGNNNNQIETASIRENRLNPDTLIDIDPVGPNHSIPLTSDVPIATEYDYQAILGNLTKLRHSNSTPYKTAKQDGGTVSNHFLNGVFKQTLEHFQSVQEQQVILCIGGQDFYTSRVTLRADPASLFNVVLRDDSPMRPYEKNIYFFDRDPSHFRFILNYLRNGAHIEASTLPSEEKTLMEMLVEARFFMLSRLQEIILERLGQVNGSRES